MKHPVLLLMTLTFTFLFQFAVGQNNALDFDGTEDYVL